MKPSFSLLSTAFLLFSTVQSISFDCEKVLVDNTRFNFKKLAGPHSVHWLEKDRPPAIHNWTWTIELCGTLKPNPDIPTKDQCGSGTMVCGIAESWVPSDDDKEKPPVKTISEVAEIAGIFTTSHGGALEPTYRRLKASDSKKEGVIVELKGGKYGSNKQKAVIEFVCDKDRDGNEGNQNQDKLRRRDDDDEKSGDENDIDSASSLQFVSYGDVGGDEVMGVLALNWKTKYACEDFQEDEGDATQKGSWGFFTWFILIGFLGISAYLIFGSWLNYNRYGARGWDLLPHGDTIRDVPYIFKDFSRKVVDTFSGSGSRGGYSAV